MTASRAGAYSFGNFDTSLNRGAPLGGRAPKATAKIDIAIRPKIQERPCIVLRTFDRSDMTVRDRGVAYGDGFSVLREWRVHKR